jgi:hypothetical protein
MDLLLANKRRAKIIVVKKKKRVGMLILSPDLFTIVFIFTLFTYLVYLFSPQRQMRFKKTCSGTTFGGTIPSPAKIGDFSE